MTDKKLRSKNDVLALIARAGYSPQTVTDLAEQLPDPVDLEAQAGLFARYGITRDALVSAFGGSL